MSDQPSPHLQAMAALLNALHHSPLYSGYAVRGSYVSRQWMHTYPRTCQDLDLLYLPEYQQDKIVADVEILLQNTKSTALDFKQSAMRFHAIWEHTISPGLRFELPYETTNGEHFELQLDIAGNDPMISPPIEQTIAGVTVRAVPLETLAAWKLHGLFEHLNGPWQSKTLWDLYVFCRYNTLDEALFVRATQLAFSSRLDPLEIVSRLLIGDFGQSKKSRQRWRKEFADFTSAEFMELAQVIDWLRDYLQPLFKAECQKSLLTLADIIQYRVRHLQAIKHLHPAEVSNKLKTLKQRRKILPHKAYNTINHLPASRLAPSERCIAPQQYALLTDSTQQRAGYLIIVQEKLDGSCVCAYRKGGTLFALGRNGDLADESPNESRRLWAKWVDQHAERFMAALQDGEWLCGEWLAMVHGTHYKLTHEPFVAFDLFTARNHSLNHQDFNTRIAKAGFVTPHLIHHGGPCSLETALEKLGNGHHGSTDQPEGLIWRLERDGKPALKAKYVRHDKQDGCYLTENSGQPTQWNITRE